MRRTKIIATLGPAVDSLEGMRALVEAGANVFRLNLSHGERVDHDRLLATAREASHAAGKAVAAMVDLQGPRLRVGRMEGGVLELKAGSKVTFTSRKVLGAGSVIPVSYDGLERDLTRGTRILVDDARIECLVLDVDSSGVLTEVVRGGLLKDRKGMNIPEVQISSPSVTPKDVEDIGWAADVGADYLAVSFVRDAETVLEVKRRLEGHGISIPVVAKIELRDAVDNIRQIVEASDAVMVARGDLGIEIPLQRVPIIQKDIVSLCNRHAKPSIIATQMLESMTENPRPTRAEVSDVANAILDGADAVMLSGETAIGRHPAEAVATMESIAKEVEVEWPSTTPPIEGFDDGIPIPVAVARATVYLAEGLSAEAIITFTTSGFTARHHSAARPNRPILAVSPSEAVVRRMALYWGVRPALITPVDDTDGMIDRAKDAACMEGLAKPGSLVVIAAGLPLDVSDNTNLIQVHTIKA